jgi:alkylation response protein AidB-like acyl-CoA dehydrogenase
MSSDKPLPNGAGFLWEPAGTHEIVTTELLTDEQRQIATAGREFSEQEILPHMKDIEAKKPGLLPRLLKKAGDLGLLMVDVPAEYGGLGLGTTTSMLLAEQFAKVGSFSVSLGAHTGIGTQPIVYFGTPAQKAAYLPDLATGKRLAAYALTETGSGSDALAARTTAVLSPDGKQWILNGTKQFITNAGFADVFVLFAKVDGTKFSGFIVDRATPGLSVGAEEHKMGIVGSSTCALTLEDVRIPVENLLGGIGKGHKIAFNTLNLGRIKLGVGTIGACKYALALSTEYAQGRQQFGKPIGSFGLVAEKLAEMAILTFVGESMGYRTTGLIDARLEGAAKTDAEKIDAIEEYTVEASIIKVFGSEALDFCADEAVQIHGGYGFIEEYQPARLLRDSRINRIFEGTNEINRLIVPGTILKRAMTGRTPLVPHYLSIKERLAKGDLPQPVAAEGELADDLQVIEYCKWITVYTFALAAETYQLKVAEEQEILGAISDMIARVYALDSVVQRVRQIINSPKASEAKKGFARDVLTAFAPRAYGYITNTGRNVIMDIADDKTLPGHLEAMSKLRMDWPTKVIAAKRRISTAVLAAGGYPNGF